MQNAPSAYQIVAPRTFVKWLLLLAVVAVAVLLVFVPAWYIQPFRPQTARNVAVSYALKSWAPWVTTLATALALWVSIALWRARTGVVRRLALLVILLPALVATWFARQNHFEWMFAPLSTVAYARADEANFVADKDMVMAIAVNGEAVAYPVRQMAYHHVVNDVVGGRPITATY
ncbi:MAG: DUF3179 domain-containing protein [Acidobacteria bacterium]|nr:DUF3179 domain-containing protein [Acidobacteriota bacterium]MBI3425507.1 DUF3179 domain-containing protein [Acidobacteriota bacterium]